MLKINGVSVAIPIRPYLDLILTINLFRLLKSFFFLGLNTLCHHATINFPAKKKSTKPAYPPVTVMAIVSKKLWPANSAALGEKKNFKVLKTNNPSILVNSSIAPTPSVRKLSLRHLLIQEQYMIEQSFLDLLHLTKWCN